MEFWVFFHLSLCFHFLEPHYTGMLAAQKIAFWVFSILKGRMKVETKKKNKNHISVFVRMILELELPLKQGSGKS